jgi:predicted GTPase
VFRFQVRCMIDVKVSQEFMTLVREKFLIGENQSFKLIDVAEQLTDQDESLNAEVARLIHSHGSEIVLIRSEWV